MGGSLSIPFTCSCCFFSPRVNIEFLLLFRFLLYCILEEPYKETISSCHVIVILTLLSRYSREKELKTTCMTRNEEYDY